MTTTDEKPRATKGLVMHSEARYYDVLAWLLTLGRERAFRERLIELARLEPNETVLDVGCGTGTLTIAAKRRVGARGIVHGIDASPEMIERAKRKAARAGVEVAFQLGIAEALPFPDASFDAVLSTLMLHHLPKVVREQCAREIHRVLRPGGRVLAVDFAAPARERRGLLARFHRHGHLALRDIVALLNDAGLSMAETGSVGVSDLQFVIATVPSGQKADRPDIPLSASTALAPLHPSGWIVLPLLCALVIAHAIALHTAFTRITLSVAALGGLAALLLLAHSPLVGLLHRWFRRRPER